MREPNIVVLAGGISSRMRRSDPTVRLEARTVSEVHEKSKAMLSVGENARPFLDYLLYNIERAGYRDVVIVVGERDSSIREYYERKKMSSQFPKLFLSYAVQPIPAGRTKPLGTADALLIALRSKRDWKGTQVTVCNSDNLYSVRALKVLQDDAHENALIDYDRSTLQFDQSRIEQFSVIRKDAEGYLLDIVEKPSPSEIESARDAHRRIGVSMNIFRFSYDRILPYLEQVPLDPVRQEKELPTAVTMLAAEHPRSVYTIPLSEHVVDLTNQSDIVKVQEHLRREFPRFPEPSI